LCDAHDLCTCIYIHKVCAYINIYISEHILCSNKPLSTILQTYVWRTQYVYIHVYTTVCTYIYIYMYTYFFNIYIYIYTYIYMYIHVYIYIYLQIYIHNSCPEHNTDKCTPVWTNLHTYMSMYLRTCVFIYLHAHMYTHIHISKLIMYRGISPEAKAIRNIKNVCAFMYKCVHLRSCIRKLVCSLFGSYGFVYMYIYMTLRCSETIQIHIRVYVNVYTYMRKI